MANLADAFLAELDDIDVDMRQCDIMEPGENTFDEISALNSDIRTLNHMQFSGSCISDLYKEGTIHSCIFLEGLERGEILDAIDLFFDSTRVTLDDVGDSQILNDPHVLELIEEIKIQSSIQVPDQTESGVSRKETEAKLQLLNESHRLNTAVERDMFLLRNKVSDIMRVKFPELDTLVSLPMEYMQVVKKILEYEAANAGYGGPVMDVSKIDLSDILPVNVIVAITVTATSSPLSGILLTEKQSKSALANCRAAIKLADLVTDIMIFVQAQMALFAPNLHALLGASLSARLVVAAGSVQQLALMPSQNIEHVGSKHNRKNLSVISGLNGKTQGILACSDIVVNTVPAFRKRAMRMLIGKTSICARVDYEIQQCHGNSTSADALGQRGAKMREYIFTMLAKIQEPAKAKEEKPLPVPDDIKSSRRGGRRYRALKEKYGASELEKQFKRMAFCVEEKGIESNDHFGIGIGMSGQGLRNTKNTMSKRERRRVEHESRMATARNLRSRHISNISGTGLSGVSSSLTFTAVTGIELVDPSKDPHEVEKRKARKDVINKKAKNLGVAGDYFDL